MVDEDKTRMDLLEERLSKVEKKHSPRERIKTACTRREFVYGGIVGATGMAAMTAKASAQSFSGDFHGIALLIGDDGDKPDPNGEFTERLDEYNFMFFSKDTGQIHTLQTGDTSWMQFGSAIRPGKSEPVNLAFDTWRTPSEKFFTLAEMDVTLDSGTATDAEVDLLVDESGGQTEDYLFSLSLSAALDDAVSQQATLWIPRGGSYQIRNTQDPNNANVIDVLREFDL